MKENETHSEINEGSVESPVTDIVTNTETTDTYVDYDNIVSDDDIDENIFSCDHCEYLSK